MALGICFDLSAVLESGGREFGKSIERASSDICFGLSTRPTAFRHVLVTNVMVYCLHVQYCTAGHEDLGQMHRHRIIVDEPNEYSTFTAMTTVTVVTC